MQVNSTSQTIDEQIGDEGLRITLANGLAFDLAEINGTLSVNMYSPLRMSQNLLVLPAASNVVILAGLGAEHLSAAVIASNSPGL